MASASKSAARMSRTLRVESDLRAHGDRALLERAIDELEAEQFGAFTQGLELASFR